MTGIKFVLYDNRRTIRQKQLLDSDLRSHAAGVAHARARQRRKLQSRPTLSPESTLTTVVLDVVSWGAGGLLRIDSIVDIYDPWQLSQGFRRDPFDCVPGTNHGVQATAFEYRKLCLIVILACLHH
jgi:hypothetical protein